MHLHPISGSSISGAASILFNYNKREVLLVGSSSGRRLYTDPGQGSTHPKHPHLQIGSSLGSGVASLICSMVSVVRSAFYQCWLVGQM